MKMKKMRFARKFDKEQQAEIAAAHAEVCQILSQIDRFGESLTDEQVEEYFRTVNRWHRTSTLRDLLVLLKTRLARLHRLIAARVEFSKIL